MCTFNVDSYVLIRWPVRTNFNGESVTRWKRLTVAIRLFGPLNVSGIFCFNSVAHLDISISEKKYENVKIKNFFLCGFRAGANENAVNRPSRHHRSTVVRRVSVEIRTKPITYYYYNNIVSLRRFRTIIAFSRSADAPQEIIS